jgi:hypothetical protein
VNVEQAKDIARRWVIEEARKMPDFYGAFFHGSINWLSDATIFPPTSDVDIIIVSTDPPPVKLGKFICRDIILDVSYLSSNQFQSPEQLLGQSHMAGSFRTPSIISDPSGQLTKIQKAVSKSYAKRKWVYKRCEHIEDKIIQNLQGLKRLKPFHEQVISWVFATGVTTHMLLVAGLKNLTVRKRYVAVKRLLSDFNNSAFYEIILGLLGCTQMNRKSVEHHLTSLIKIFDVAKTMIKTPFSFASDISDIARPIVVDGSRKMIHDGYHRETIFWIIVTYSRCQSVLCHDAPMEMKDKFSSSYRQLLSDIGITSFSDLQQRSKQIEEFLPCLWKVTESVITKSPDIKY